LIADLPDKQVRKRFEELLEVAAVPDRFYIPTRYPDGLSDLTPGNCCFRKDAALCIAQPGVSWDEAGTLWGREAVTFPDTAR